MQIEEEDFERPASVGSLSKLIEKVRIDSTPTAEKELEFGDVYMSLPAPSMESLSGASYKSVTTPEPPQLELQHLESESPTSFRRFLMNASADSSPDEYRSPTDDSGQVSPVLEMREASSRGHYGLGLDLYHEQRTPTQEGFFK